VGTAFTLNRAFFSHDCEMSDSSCWDWLLMAAAKWQPVGRQMGAGGAANGNRRGGIWKPAGRQMEADGTAHASRRDCTWRKP
ncbi:MAG: hypothetical protein ACOCOU_09040, partial [Prevotella sp.]